jgi:hypothetical protein
MLALGGAKSEVRRRADVVHGEGSVSTRSKSNEQNVYEREIEGIIKDGHAELMLDFSMLEGADAAQGN